MSMEAIAAARKLTLPPRDKFVLLALADYANDDGEAWPKQSTLAQWTCYDRSTVNQALTSLEATGLIVSRQTYRDDGGKSVKVYRLAFLDAPHVAQDNMPHVEEDNKGMSAPATSPCRPRQHPHVAQGNSKNPQEGTPKKEPKKEIHTRGAKPEKPAGKKREPTHEFDPTSVPLPPNFDRERFMEFCENRLKAKSPMTELALRRFVKKHERHDKATLDQMFDNAIVAGWKDLWPLKNQRAATSKPAARLATADDFRHIPSNADLLGVGGND